MTYEFAIRPYVTDEGVFVDAAADKGAWLEIRRSCIGATDARKLVRLNGQQSKQWGSLLDEKASGSETFVFDAFARGIEREPIIAAWVQAQYPEEDFFHNSQLLHGVNRRHVATPDMVGKDSLCEIKVSTSPLKSGLTTYRDQMQWQMHVTGADLVLFVVENRDTEQIETHWVERNQERIDVLVEFADIFLAELDELVADLPSEYEDEDEDDEFEFEFESPTEAAEDPFFEGIDLSLIDFTQFDGDMNNVQDEKTWSKKERIELVARYCLGQDINTIAREMDAIPRVIAIELSQIILGQVEPLIDESAQNFGNSWSDSDVESLTSMYRLSTPIPTIAATLGRDLLGICFQIFNRFSPQVPLRVLKKYGLNVEVLELMQEGITPASNSEPTEIQMRRRVRFFDSDFDE